MFVYKSFKKHKYDSKKNILEKHKYHIENYQII